MDKIFEQFKNDKLYEEADAIAGNTVEEEITEEIIEEEVAGEERPGEENEEEEGEVIGEESEEDKEARLKKEATDNKDTETTDEQKKDSVIKQVLAKHPKFFKEHPELRSAYFENKQFKEVFTSVEEAKEVVEQSEILKTVSANLQKGDPKQVIEYLKEAPKTLTEFTRNLIKDLPKEVFSDALAPSIIEMLSEVREVAKMHKNTDLENSIAHISMYLFKSHELPTIKKEEAKVEEKENPLLASIAKNFSEEVEEDVIGTLNSTIDTSLASLKNVKPAVRKTIVNEIKEELDKLFKVDTAHNKLMQKHWSDAKTSNYGKQSKASIKSAYLAAVNKRLPEVRATVLKNNGFVIKQGQKKTTTEDNAATKFTKNTTNTSSSMSSQDTKVAEMKKAGKSEREIMDAIIK